MRRQRAMDGVEVSAPGPLAGQGRGVISLVPPGVRTRGGVALHRGLIAGD